MSGNNRTKQNWVLNNIAQDPINKFYERLILEITKALHVRYRANTFWYRA